MHFKYILIIWLCVFNVCCKLISQTTVATSVNAPSWVNKKPVSSSKYTGIGIATKSSGYNYQSEAKKNALFDLSSEIKVNISTNSILYTVQNNNQFNENFNSLIKLSNSDNIEGYTLVDTYENEKQYWVYYELDKVEYENIKLRKKQLSIDKADNLINLSVMDEKENSFSACLKKRIQAFAMLSPYFNEDVKLDAGNNVKTIFDLSNLIQKQLQGITVVPQKIACQLKPYQPIYQPLIYKLSVKNKSPLIDFPFVIKSDNDKVRVGESSGTNASGELEIRVNSVKPLNQQVYFILSPDIAKLMGSDSISRASVLLLKQFIETTQLKTYAVVSPIALFINCTEKNLSVVVNQKIIEGIIKNKFSGTEIKLVETKELADFLIEATADTEKDISSDILFKNYNVALTVLKINIILRNVLTKELLYKSELSGIYGYATTVETAGLNSYFSGSLKTKLTEDLFFLKRKFIVY